MKCKIKAHMHAVYEAHVNGKAVPGRRQKGTKRCLCDNCNTKVDIESNYCQKCGRDMPKNMYAQDVT